MPKGHYERKPEAQRFWEKVDQQEDESVCWDWLGSVDKDGYGWFSWESSISSNHQQTSKTVHAHKYAGFLKFGASALDKGILVRHTCDRRICVNPSHLLLGTAADNSADMVVRNRQACGEKQHQAILSDQQAKDVLIKYAKEKAEGRLYGALERLALEFNCPKQAIYRITSRKTYRHIVI